MILFHNLQWCPLDDLKAGILKHLSNISPDGSNKIYIKTLCNYYLHYVPSYSICRMIMIGDGMTDAEARPPAVRFLYQFI